jgi:N-acetylmuramoyl-L-alanine amidase
MSFPAPDALSRVACLPAGCVPIGVSPLRAQESFTLDLEGRRVEIPTRRVGSIRYVSLSDLARGFGGRVEWLDVGERAAGIFLGERVVFRRDLPYVEARGGLHQIPHAPRFQDGEMLVPFSFIQQGLPAIFPERFNFQAETASLRQGPPGGALDQIEYLITPGLTTLRFFFAGAPSPPRISADNSLPHTLVLRLDGAGAGRIGTHDLRQIGLVDSVRVAADTQGSERLLFHLNEEAFLYQVARLESPSGLEVTIYSPAAGVDAETVLARNSVSTDRGLPPPARRPGEAGAPAARNGPDVAAGGGGSATPGMEVPKVETPLATELPGARKQRTGIQTVVLDAGHGGRDVGAIGPTGVLEKDVALQVARALRTELQRRAPELRVILTREEDVFVPLTARTRMANEVGADLFLSIHCNSSPRRSGRGFETYFLSEAKTEDARRVAKMENSSLRFENPEIDPDRLGELNFILWDLAQNEYLRESSQLATLVQEGLADELDLRDRGVKQAGFWVLNGAYMPAILIETAFISNPDEEQLLASGRFQDQLVDGLADSVMEYVDTYERKVTVQEAGA